MNYLIYRITNNLNNKTYIGCHKTDNVDDGYMGSGKILKRAIEKYGINNFTKEVLHKFDNPEDMFNMERELVNEDFVKEQNTYNIKVGGNGGFDHINNDPVERARVSKISSEKNKGVTGGTKNWTDESRRKVLEASKKGDKTRVINAQSESARIKRKETFKKRKHAQGHRNSQFGTHWYCDSNGKNRTRYKEGEQPKDWITTTEYKEQKMKYSKRWYNDGVKNYYLVMPNPLVEELDLVKGRITT